MERASKRDRAPKQEYCPGAATALAASSGAYSNNGNAPDPQTPGKLTSSVEFTHLINGERLATYLQACGGDFGEALRLYAWNIEVSSAFWGSFSVLEVALRNALHGELSDLAGQQDWWNASVGLHEFERRRVADAIGAAHRTKGPGFGTGHVVAELNFGFWTGLLANRYHQRLWEPALHRAFPNSVAQRRELHRHLESLRKLRNRIAHHEPIFARNLALDHHQLLAVLAAISPAAVDWVQSNSRVLLVLSRRNDVVRGVQNTVF